MYRIWWSLFPALALLTGCAIWPWPDKQDPGRIQVDVIDRSAYCHTPTEEAAVHYFSDPPALEAWLAERDIREFRSGAASLSAVLVVEMGRRPSSGYALAVREGEARVREDALVLALDWIPPSPEAMTAQVVTSPCLLLQAPAGEYERVIVTDGTGKLRAQTQLP